MGQGLVFLLLLLCLRLQASPCLIVSFFLRGAFNAVRPLAAVHTGKVLSSERAGLSFGIFNTAYNLSPMLALYTAGSLYTSRRHLRFLVSAATIPVMTSLSFELVKRGYRLIR